jgi:hypothetical protein
MVGGWDRLSREVRMSTRERAVVAFDCEEAEKIGTSLRQLMLAPGDFEPDHRDGPFTRAELDVLEAKLDGEPPVALTDREANTIAEALARRTAYSADSEQIKTIGKKLLGAFEEKR